MRAPTHPREAATACGIARVWPRADANEGYQVGFWYTSQRISMGQSSRRRSNTSRPLTQSVYVMYSRTLFASPNVTLGGRLRRWTASAANPRLQTLDSQCQLSAAERRRMICATSIDKYPDCGFDTYLVGRCVDRTKDATRDLARMNLHRAVNWEAVR